jgi:hypothetical protein
MRYLAIARFRLLTIIRTASGIFLIAAIPVGFFAMMISMPEPDFRGVAEHLLRENARAAVVAWFFHALIICFAAMMSGKVKTPDDDGMPLTAVPDLMDSAPISLGARFWGEALGTFGAMGIVHVCCLPLLAAVVALNPLPTTVFVWFEATMLALLFLASASAAWQRRAPRTKFSGTRGPRNAAVIATLFIFALMLTTRWAAFRDALENFLAHRISMPAWRELAASVSNPLLLAILLALLYAGCLAYYYAGSTRQRVWEN